MIEKIEMFNEVLNRNLDLSKIIDMIPMTVLVSTSDLDSTADKLTDTGNTTNLVMVSRLSDYMGLYDFLLEYTNLPADIKPGRIVVNEIPVFKELDLLSSAIYTLALIKLLVIK